MTLLEELKYRGFLNQCTDEVALDKILKSKQIKFYIGFDCTAKSLHVGSLIQIIYQEWLIQLKNINKKHSLL